MRRPDICKLEAYRHALSREVEAIGTNEEAFCRARRKAAADEWRDERRVANVGRQYA